MINKTRIIVPNSQGIDKSKLQYLIATPDQGQYVAFVRGEKLPQTNCLWYENFELALADYQTMMRQGVQARIIMLEVPMEVLEEIAKENEPKIAKS